MIDTDACIGRRSRWLRRSSSGSARFCGCSALTAPRSRGMWTHMASSASTTASKCAANAAASARSSRSARAGRPQGLGHRPAPCAGPRRAPSWRCAGSTMRRTAWPSSIRWPTGRRKTCGTTSAATRCLQRAARQGLPVDRLRAVHARGRRGEDVRAGRWWWERARTKECGLHVRAQNHAQNPCSGATS